MRTFFLAVLALTIVACSNNKEKRPLGGNTNMFLITEEGVPGVILSDPTHKMEETYDEVLLGMHKILVTQKGLQGALNLDNGYFLLPQYEELYFFKTFKGDFYVTFNGKKYKRLNKVGNPVGDIDAATVKEMVESAKTYQEYPADLWIDEKYY